MRAKFGITWCWRWRKNNAKTDRAFALQADFSRNSILWQNCDRIGQAPATRRAAIRAAMAAVSKALRAFK